MSITHKIDGNFGNVINKRFRGCFVFPKSRTNENGGNDTYTEKRLAKQHLHYNSHMTLITIPSLHYKKFFLHYSDSHTEVQMPNYFPCKFKITRDAIILAKRDRRLLVGFARKNENSVKSTRPE